MVPTREYTVDGVRLVYRVPLRIAESGPYDQTIWGELSYLGATPPPTVQLLVHGASYNHLYWASYVRSATLAGYATFAVDALGAGQSSKPPSDRLSVGAEVVALHDVVTALRTGALGPGFQRVIWVGHSLGSTDGIIEAVRYHDIDALVVTGLAHGQSSAQAAALAAELYPAAEDPRFAAAGLDPGYLTFRPGGRAKLFYAPETSDPAALERDERTKDVVAFAAKLGEVQALLLPPRPADGLTYQVDVPVLSVLGQHDAMFCGDTWLDGDTADSVYAYEAPYYGPDAHLQVIVAPGTGHCLATSTTAPSTHDRMLAWSLEANACPA